MMSSWLPFGHAHKRHFEEIEATMQVSDGVGLAYRLKRARVNSRRSPVPSAVVPSSPVRI